MNDTVKAIPDYVCEEPTFKGWNDGAWQTLLKDEIQRCNDYWRGQLSSLLQQKEKEAMTNESDSNPTSPEPATPPAPDETPTVASFLRPYVVDTIEEAGYEFANAKTEEQRKEWWDVIMDKMERVRRYHSQAKESGDQ